MAVGQRQSLCVRIFALNKSSHLDLQLVLGDEGGGGGVGGEGHGQEEHELSGHGDV